MPCGRRDREREGSGLVRPGAAEYSVVEGAAGDGSPEARERVETLPAFLGAGNPGRGAAAPRFRDAGRRFLRTSLGCTIAGMRVSGDGFIVVTAGLSAVAVVEASIAVGPEGSFACTVSVGDTRLACTVPDLRGLRGGSQRAPGGGRRAGLGDSNRERSPTPA